MARVGGEVTEVSFIGVAVEFGGTPILRDVTFAVARRDRWGIVGRNGAGKTTLFRLMTGDVEPTRGTVARSPAIRFSVLEQHRHFEGAETVWEAAAGQFADLLALERSLAEQGSALGALGDRSTPAMLARYDRDLERFEREGGYTLAPRIDAVLHGLGFDPEEARQRPLAALSGGERGRLGLVRQLMGPADVLLLDEPTNHLDLETTDWLENYLRDVDATVMVVSHDRVFLQRLVDHVLHVEAGTAIPYAGGYDGFVAQRTERRLSRQRAFEKQRKVIGAEEDYIRRNIAGGNSAQAKGRRRRLARVARLSPPPGEDGAMALRLEPAERGGDQVLVLERAGIDVGDRVLLRDFSARVARGEAIGLVGPNGAGKSTLLRAIAGERALDRGKVRIPGSIVIGYYRQDLAQVPTDMALYDIIADRRPAWGRGAVQAHLGRFGFSGDAVLRRAATLSGGEKARVALALLMLEHANLLLLDEPTNHLDVESIEALEDAVDAYEGTVVLVSHDRALLRALTTRIWVMHGGQSLDFPGTFAEWETASRERAHAASVAAAEEESIRRVRGRRQTRRAVGELNQLSALQVARRVLDAAEAAVATQEARLGELRAALDDPALYATPAGIGRAGDLGRELEATRRAMESAFDEWAAATAALERLG